MATISAVGSNGHHAFDLTVTENSTSTSNNTSTIGFSFSLSPVDLHYDWYNYYPPNNAVTYTITINGTSYTGYINSYDGVSTVVVKSGTQTVTHNTDGTKSISFSFSVTSQSASYLTGSASASGTMALTTIPRNPSVSQSLSSKTETTLTIKWSSDSVIDKVESTIDNGTTWYTKATNANAKSGTFNITGLSADTTYSVKVRLRSKASQLSTISSASSYSTYAYPNPNSTPNFTIGSSVKIGVFNPLGRSVTVQMRVVGSGVVAAQATTSGTSVTLTPTASVLYNSILNSKTGSYYCIVWYNGNSYGSSTGTYSIPSSAVPSFTAFTYEDRSSRVTSVTGNNQKIVQNKSKVAFSVTGLQGYENSNVTSCSVTCMGVTYPMTIDGTSAEVTMVNINSPTDVSATLTVTDSRGATATGSVTLAMWEYSDPYANITAVRKNNYYSETDLTINSTIASLNNQNTVQVAYRYKRVDGDYDSYTTVQDGSTTTLTLDNHYAWTIQVRLIDRLTTVTQTVDVLVGVPILFIDRRMNAVGFNCFPSETNEVLADGHDLRKHIVTASLTNAPSTTVATTYSSLTLDASNAFGDKLTFDTISGGIEIGAGVTKVLVSGSMSIHASATAGARAVRICLNSHSEANTVGWAYQSAEAYDYVQLVVPPQLVDVQAGDVLNMYYYAQSGDAFSGLFGGRTSMTVEYVG